MQDQLYREIILEHWKNPQNYGVITNPDIDVSDFNPLCGDEIHLTAKVKDNKIAAIAFEAQGCAISKASASLLTEEIKGKSLDEIKALKPEEIIELLEVDLTPARTKCALLIQQVIRKGLPK